MIFKTINPSTEEPLNEYRALEGQHIERIVQQSYHSYKNWSHRTLDTRAEKISTLAECLNKNQNELSHMISLEMGKIHSEALEEVKKCAKLCQYYAEIGPEFLRDQNISTEFTKSYISYQPTGCILGIMPWNFPFWQVFRFAIPTLLSGNTVLLKHAPNVLGCALLIEKIFQESGFNDFEFQNVILTNEQTLTLIGHSLVKGVSLTGSTQAGKSVAQTAGHHLKKFVLELGGSDPYILLDDADLNLALKKSLQARFLNCGQTCIAAKRFIVTEKNYNTFKSLLFNAITEIQFGDPFDSKTQIGPLARIDLREKLHEQILKSKDQGAQVMTGGVIPSGSGYFYTPTLITGSKPGICVFEEETFGPVVSLSVTKDEEEAIEWGNHTPYGLGAAIFSQDVEKAEFLAKKHLDAGSVFINDLVRSDPRLPFGGTKESGIGRELSSYGTHEFVNIKTIVQS